MTVYLYGLISGASAPAVPPDLPGIAASRLRVLASGDGKLAAIVSDVSSQPRSASLEDIRAHDAALQGVVQQGITVAAVRFGQAFNDDDDVRDHVATHDERIVDLLERFAGCVEMRLLLAASESADAPVADEGPGSAYLRQLQARVTRPVEGVRLQPALGPMVRHERVEQLGSRGAVFAHLIRREDEHAYREAVATLPALADARIVGPLPIYSFMDAE